MSKLNKLFEAAKLTGAIGISALSTPGCASDCELEPDTPVLKDPIAFCQENRKSTITCLQTQDKGGDKLDCSAINLRCNEPLEEDVNESDYCVEGEARLEF